MKYTDKLLQRKLGLKLSVILFLFWLLSITLGLSRVAICGVEVWYKYKVFASSQSFLVLQFNDKTCLNVSQAGSLRKAPLSAETLDFK